MNKWLIRQFVINRSGEDKARQRLLCGRFSGVVGILLYTVLGLVKILIGLLTGSVAVIADAVNNLADTAVSIITLIGFSLASRKSDAGHPFGHARYEYMTGVIIAALVIFIGVKLIQMSFEKVLHPTPLEGDILFMVLLGVMILLNFWLFRFNLALSRLINSASLKATGRESLNDSIITLAVLIALALFRFAGINIDGYIGIVVGLFVIYSGLTMVKETAGPLLGQSPDPQTVKEIADLVLSQNGVCGIHDLIVHDYGPGHIFASVHIEVDSREDIFKSHALVDDIEKLVQDKLNIMLVGHMDPLDTQNSRLTEIREELARALSGIEGVRETHDFRIVDGPEHSNVIFDVVVSHDKPERTFAQVEMVTQEILAGIDPKYVAVINHDLDFGTRKTG